jgi:flagellin-like protein
MHKDGRVIMRKGITPIISTIVLLLITVALAGAAWVYINNFMDMYTGKTFTVSTGGVFCDAGGKFHVRLVNSGSTGITTADWIAANVTNATTETAPPASTAGGDVGLAGLNPSAIAVKQAKEFTETGGVSGRSYMVSIGTATNTVNVPVTCP